MSPYASASAQPTNESELRVVQTYDGAVIVDLGSHIEVQFTKTPVKGVRQSLKLCDWWRTRKAHWRKASSPAAIFEAQNALRLYYGEPTQ